MNRFSILLLKDRVRTLVMNGPDEDWLSRCCQFCILIMLMILEAAPATAVESFLPTKEEIRMMPPLCQRLYGPRIGLEERLIPRSSYINAKGCTRYHYYCDAHTSLVRAQTSMFRNPARAQQKLKRAIKTLQGQVKHHASTPNCATMLQGDVNFTLGYALSLLAKVTKSNAYYVEAISPLTNAIKLNSKDVRAYRTLGDVYVKLDNSNLAEETIYRGLRIAPRSKSLLRRYKKLGGKRQIPSSEAGSVGDSQVE